jgi:uncharacterized membrane protein (DUF4010 family)
MHDLDLLQRLAVALAIGLLIGIERGWTMREEAEGERTVGLRTLALTGLLGGVAGALALRLPGGGAVLGLVFLAYAIVIGFLRYREMARDKTFGATTVLAAYVAFGLGALAVVGDMGAAAAVGVAAAALLALKAVLHAWIKRLTWEELRAGLMLLAMTLILLPVLPNRGYGPFEAVNPYELWLMTILIAGVSSIGYVAMKWVGGRHGVALSGVAGGLVSSTAVTLSFSRLARETPGRRGALVAGAVLAGATMMLRILIIAASVNAGLLRWLLLPLVFAAAASAGFAGWHLWRSRDEGGGAPLALKNPFELATVLQFSAFLALVMIAAKGLTAAAGGWGAFGLAAVSGIADVDAITLTLSRLGGGELAAETAAQAILLAAAVNTLAKAALAWIAGGRGPGVRLAVGAVLALASGLAGFALSTVWDPFAALGTHPLAT